MLSSKKALSQSTHDKQYALIIGAILGLAGAAAVHHWPKNAQVLQMLLYSVVVIGALLWAAWSRRRNPRFTMAIAIMALLHCVVVVGAKDMFPFRTIFFMVPIALSELVIVFTLMLKILGF